MIFRISLINLDNENNYVYVKLYKEVTQNQLIWLIESLRIPMEVVYNSNLSTTSWVSDSEDLTLKIRFLSILNF